MTEDSKNEKRWYKKPVIWGQGILLFFLIVFAIGFAAAMFSDTAEECIGGLLGLTGNTAKNDILSFIGIAMGGILIALQALASYRRAKAMEDAANAQATAANAQATAANAQATAAKAQATSSMEQAQANLNIEKGQRQERMKNAIEHLGHASDSVRLGGAYELFHLAEDNRELNQTVLDILCTHIRQTTSEEKYQDNYPEKPSEEIQSLLTLLFVREHEIFSGCHINLQSSWLNGANLDYARLVNADLFGVDLEKASLIGAKMQAISLSGASLIDTCLAITEMQGAKLVHINLMNAQLYDAKMQGADLTNADLTKSYLSYTKMQAACFYNAQIQKANFANTQIQGARFGQSYFGADFKLIIKKSTKKDDDFDIFHFDDITDKKRILKGIVRGHYTVKEAKKWITKYNKAMAPFTKSH